MKLNIYITDGDYIGPITTIDLTEVTAKLTLQSSIERVINTSYRIVEKHSRDDEDGLVNLEDWDEWKHIVVSLFDAVRNCAFLLYNRGK